MGLISISHLTGVQLKKERKREREKERECQINHIYRAKRDGVMRGKNFDISKVKSVNLYINEMLLK